MPATLEAILTRKFHISFIDARTIATEAKLNLEIHSYPTQEQKELLIAEASTIFKQYPEEVRGLMQVNQMSLEDSKMNASFSSLDLSGRSTTSQMSSSSGHSLSSVSSKRSIGFFLHR